MGRLEGKTCLVSAAGQGIGKASALAMAREGAKVWATDVNEQALGALQDGGCVVRLLDVRDPASIAAAVEATGPLDVLFNCAGFVAHGGILDCDEEQWAFSLDLNMTAMYRMIRAYLPGMLDNGGGTVINMSSVASSVIGAPNRFVYGATKAGVIGITKALAADHVTQGIRAHAICPGTVESPSLDQRMEALGQQMGSFEAAKNSFISRQPMGRLGTPEEIASLVVYLASDEATYSTGTVHVIDGGWSNV
ncbi:MAG: SDR family oxidoreductase [Pseudomonadota bacterium]